MEKITKDEFKIVSEHLTNLIDWEEVYNSSASISKKKFTKEDIIDTVKRLVSEYPHFDTYSKLRIESNSSVFSCHFGFFNNYIYLFTNAKTYYTNNGWFMTEDALMNAVDYHKDNDHHIVIFDYTHYLRMYKIKKVQQKINI